MWTLRSWLNYQINALGGYDAVTSINVRADYPNGVMTWEIADPNKVFVILSDLMFNELFPDDVDLDMATNLGPFKVYYIGPMKVGYVVEGQGDHRHKIHIFSRANLNHVKGETELT